MLRSNQVFMAVFDQGPINSAAECLSGERNSCKILLLLKSAWLFSLVHLQSLQPEDRGKVDQEPLLLPHQYYSIEYGDSDNPSIFY